jgi:hypothetical protein
MLAQTSAAASGALLLPAKYLVSKHNTMNQHTQNIFVALLVAMWLLMSPCSLYVCSCTNLLLLLLLLLL